MFGGRVGFRAATLPFLAAGALGVAEADDDDLVVTTEDGETVTTGDEDPTQQSTDDTVDTGSAS